MSGTSEAPRRVAIISSNGVRATYGGWDQLVNNLVDLKAPHVSYLIFNPKDTPVARDLPQGTVVRQLPVGASGLEGLIFDYWSSLLAFRRVDVVLLLGAQAMPFLTLLKPFWRVKSVSNVGGIEWERPQFSRLSKLFLKWCFRLSLRYADTVVLDNEQHRKYLPRCYQASVMTIPYGGTIDTSLSVTATQLEKYPFLQRPYFLSISRAVADNHLRELCRAFVGKAHRLVLVSNFSRSEYGRAVLSEYGSEPNLTLIDGLYVKPELDLIRRNCSLYIHTHSLCGSAPSLIEMIVARRPVLSIDVPQNRYTLSNSGGYFKEFSQLSQLVDDSEAFENWIPNEKILVKYRWENVVKCYEDCYRTI